MSIGTAYVLTMCALVCAEGRTLTRMKYALIHGGEFDTAHCARGSQLAPMTTTPDLLSSLRADWRRYGAGPAARVSARAFAHRHAMLDLDFVEDLVDVVALLESHGPRNVLERARLIQALLEDARDPLLHRALVQTLLPGIVSVCRQLRFGDGIVDDPSETLAVAVTLAGEIVSDWAGQSRPYAGPDLLSALRGRLRRYLLKEKDARRALTGNVAVEFASGANSTLETRLEQLCGTPHERLARLTYARVFEGVSLKALAAHDHSAPASLQSELRLFALRHLI